MESAVKNPYVFNSEGVHDYKKETDPLSSSIFAVFLRDSALVIEEKIKANGMNGGYYYKRLSTRIYKAQANKHGERYLRVLRKTGSGVMLSVRTNELARSDRFLYAYKEGQSDYCAEMIELIEEHLSRILGFKFTHGPLPTVDDPENGHYSPDYLYYPFYRDSSNKVFAQKFLIANKKPNLAFYEQQEVSNLPLTGRRGLQAALRRSKTQDDFVRNMVYKSSVKTAEDVQQLIDSPQLLSLFAKIDLRLGAKEAVSCGLAYVFENYNDYMTASEYYAFKFMLSNLPKNKVPEVFTLALRLAKFRKEKEVSVNLKFDITNLNRFNYGSSCAGNVNQLVKSFQQVSPKDRRQFAMAFWEEFQTDYLRSEKNFIPHSEQPKKRLKKEGVGREIEINFIKVADVFMKAYAKTRLASIPEGAKESFGKVAATFFGQDISQFSEATFHKAEIAELNVSMEYVSFHRLGYSTNGNLLALLARNSETKKFFDDGLIFSPIKHLLSHHLLDYSDGMLVSDLEQILMKAVLKIDEGLLKVGQPLTSSNRMIYLQSTERDRKFKSNWRYYSLGVSPDELSTYKVAGIRTKKDISFWIETKNSVPEEMYRELLNDFAYGSTKSDAKSMVSIF
jgi:hypothetical protein